jgi:hypothetical protein
MDAPIDGVRHFFISLFHPNESIANYFVLEVGEWVARSSGSAVSLPSTHPFPNLIPGLMSMHTI